MVTIPIPRALRPWLPLLAGLALLSCMGNPEYVDRVDVLKPSRLPYMPEPVDDAPVVRRAGSSEVIYLHSKQAKVLGPKMPTRTKYEHRADGSRDNIGFWHDPA